MNAIKAASRPFIAIFCSLLCSLAHATLPASVSAALAKHGIEASEIAIQVQALDNGEIILSHQTDQAMNPASVMKLVTAFVALDRFGPAKQWRSRFLTLSAPQNGVLKGDLFLQGGGDPMLDNKRLSQVFQRLKKSALQHITGELVIDEHVLALPAHDPAAFDQRPLRPYNSGATGFLVNFNTLGLILRPDPNAGESVHIMTEPSLPGLVIDNRLRSTKGACGIWHSQLNATLQPATAQQTADRLILTGALPIACGQRHWGVAPYSAQRFARKALQEQLKQNAIRLDGPIRHGKTAANAKYLVLEESSPTLAEIIREMNKWSSNVIARQLFALIGADADPTTANAVVSARQTVQKTLLANQIEPRGLVIDNGSGLSRRARISARTLSAMLYAAWHKPWMPEYIAALSILGVDGTTSQRLRKSPARGQAHLKTGAINNARAIAGYMLDRHKRRYIVVMLVNSPAAAASKEAQDALLKWVQTDITQRN